MLEELVSLDVQQLLQNYIFTLQQGWRRQRPAEIRLHMFQDLAVRAHRCLEDEQGQEFYDLGLNKMIKKAGFHRR